MGAPIQPVANITLIAFIENQARLRRSCPDFLETFLAVLEGGTLATATTLHFINDFPKAPVHVMGATDRPTKLEEAPAIVQALDAHVL